MSPEQLASIKVRACRYMQGLNVTVGLSYEIAGNDVLALVAEVERLTQALLDLTDGSGERAGDLCAELTRTRAEVERLRESSAHVCKIWHRQNSGKGTRPTTAIGVAIRDMGKSIGWKP